LRGVANKSCIDYSLVQLPGEARTQARSRRSIAATSGVRRFPRAATRQRWPAAQRSPTGLASIMGPGDAPGGGIGTFGALSGVLHASRRKIRGAHWQLCDRRHRQKIRRRALRCGGGGAGRDECPVPGVCRFDVVPRRRQTAGRAARLRPSARSRSRGTAHRANRLGDRCRARSPRRR
jgi:hypothetical protein